MADQNAGDRGVFVPYFNRLASTYKSIGLLALQFNTPILCGVARRVPEAERTRDGLGYRIFLVRRYLAMDIIIPYVLWITFLGFFFDWCLQRFITLRYPWYRVEED